MTAIPRSSYILALTVLGASFIGLVTALALPFVLSPVQYITFSLVAATSQLITSIAYEWIRISVIRHIGGDRPDLSTLRSELTGLYVVTTAALISCAIIFLLGSLLFNPLLVAGLTCLCAALQGVFEGRSAWARAHFDNLRLSVAAIARPIFMFALVIGFATISRSAIWAILGLCSSYPLSMLVFGDRPSGILTEIRLDRSRVLSLFKFGSVAALGANLSLAVPAALRAIIIAALGPTAAGGSLLALDIGQRAFGTLGTSLNTLSLQSLIRTFDSVPKEDGVRYARNFIGTGVLMVSWVTVILALLSPLAGNFAPTAYRENFITWAPLVLILVAALSARQYTMDPVFIVYHRVEFLPVSPALIMLLLGICLLAHRTFGISDTTFFYGLALSAVGGIISAIICLRILSSLIIPWSLFATAALSVGLAQLSRYMMPEAAPWLSIPSLALMATILFWIPILFFNTLSLRTNALLLLGKIVRKSGLTNDTN
ncbi:MAG: hypothetical protein WC729_26200 [Sphingomonas sp.]|jgi:O-antigen/teichoic acid export membrane protein|uniref:hypothetical protein n=1 Tax=Sphingomonas sp. TaxID=28214 RepID=UPI0035694646